MTDRSTGCTEYNITQYYDNPVDMRNVVRAVWRLRYWAAIGWFTGGLVGLFVHALMPRPAATATAVLVPLGGASVSVATEMVSRVEGATVEEPTKRDDVSVLIVTQAASTKAAAEEALHGLVLRINETVRIGQADLTAQSARLDERVRQLERRRPRDGTTAYWQDVTQVAGELLAEQTAALGLRRFEVAALTTAAGEPAVARWQWMLIGYCLGAVAGLALGWIVPVIREMQ